MKSKRLLAGILGAIGIISVTFGVSVAFFNYTRTGVANSISVGRISFVTRQTKTISLTNLFPIDPTNSEEMADATKVGTLIGPLSASIQYANNLSAEVLTSIIPSAKSTLKVGIPVAIISSHF